MRSLVVSFALFAALVDSTRAQLPFGYYAPGTNARGTWQSYAGAADATYYPYSYSARYPNASSFRPSPARSAPYRFVYGSQDYSDNLGLQNEYGQYGSRYSNQSWRNEYATDAPRIYSSNGTYRGRLSTNEYDSESISNPYGQYGSEYSGESINNPYGAGNPYSGETFYIVPSE